MISEKNKKIINTVKSKGYIEHINFKYGVDLSKVDLMQDIIINESLILLDDLEKRFHTELDLKVNKRFSINEIVHILRTKNKQRSDTE